MAFDEVTLFRFDLTDAQFGPREMDVPDRVKGKVDTGSSDDDVEATVESEDESGGPGIGGMIVMAVVVSIVATLIARRLRGGDEDEAESAQIEFEDETAPEIGA